MQTTKRFFLAVVRGMASSPEQSFHPHLSSTNSSRLVPMDLGFADKTIRETNRRNPLALTPPPAAIQPPQPGAIPNRMRDRNGLDLPDRADELEVHLALRRCIIGVS